MVHAFYDNYIDEYSSVTDDDNDDGNGDEDIYYHNYSVDYANQLLNGEYLVSSRLPRSVRKYREGSSSRLTRVSTIDLMDLHDSKNTQSTSVRSQPKFSRRYRQDSLNSVGDTTNSRLPSLAETRQELERRAARSNNLTSNDQDFSNEDSSSLMHGSSPRLSEEQLRQVQLQQQAFQQHLLNMERNLMEQRQLLETNQNNSNESTVTQRRSHHSHQDSLRNRFDNLNLNDDQAEIAQLIENDPYVAAAMEDFVKSHHLLDYSRSKKSSDSYSNASSSSSSSSSRSRTRSNPSMSADVSQLEFGLLFELKEIRRLMQLYINEKLRGPRTESPSIKEDRRLSGGFPVVQPADVPPTRKIKNEKAPSTLEKNYENVVNVIRQTLQQRSESEQDQMLKPSQIAPELRANYQKRNPNPNMNRNIERMSKIKLSSPTPSLPSSFSLSTKTKEKVPAAPPLPPRLISQSNQKPIAESSSYQQLNQYSSLIPAPNGGPHLTYGQQANFVTNHYHRIDRYRHFLQSNRFHY